MVRAREKKRQGAERRVPLRPSRILSELRGPALRPSTAETAKAAEQAKMDICSAFPGTTPARTALYLNPIRAREKKRRRRKKASSASFANP